MLEVDQLRRAQRPVVAVVLGVLLAIGVFVLVGRFAGFTQVLDSIREADPVWLPICFGAVALEYAGYVAAFRGVAAHRGGPRFGLWESTVIVFASLGATRLVAAAGAGGLVVNYWALRRAGSSHRDGIVRVLALNTLLYGILGVMALTASALLLVGIGGDAPPAMTLTWIAVVGGCLVGAALVSAPWRARRLASPSVEGRLRRWLGYAVAGVLFVRELARRRNGSPRTIGGAAIWWAGDIACLWAALRSFGGGASLVAVVLAYCTGYAANLLPLPTGGLGGVDAAMAFGLTAVGVPLATALLAVIAYRLFSFWIPTVPGAVAFAALPRIGRGLTRFRPEPRATS